MYAARGGAAGGPDRDHGAANPCQLERLDGRAPQQRSDRERDEHPADPTECRDESHGSHPQGAIQGRQAQAAGDAPKCAQNQRCGPRRRRLQHDDGEEQQEQADDLRAPGDEHAAGTPRRQAARKVTGAPGRRGSHAEQDARFDQTPLDSVAAECTSHL